MSWATVKCHRMLQNHDISRKLYKYRYCIATSDGKFPF